MFDVRRVAQQIRDARIGKNMTQSNLADEMGVSYQAVSNWERGNSLPDISKYEDLCRILDLKLEDLLGGGSETDAVNKFIDHKNGEDSTPMTVEEIESVADLIAPEDLKKTVNEHMDKIAFDRKDIRKLAPFLDKETLGELVDRLAPDDIQAIVELAPFLPQDKLVSLAAGICGTGKVEMSKLARIMPFLSKDSADLLVENLEAEDIEHLAKIAPFLRKKTIRRLLDRLEDDDIKFKTLLKVAPFLDKEMLEEILEDMGVKDIGRMKKMAPFISQETLKKWIENALKNEQEE